MMTPYDLIFYLLAAGIILSTLIAVTRKDPVHAVLFLVISFFGSAALFYLLGAPLLAALEVIIYAGAIMILFLFMVMMMSHSSLKGKLFSLRTAIPALIVGGLFLALVLLLSRELPGEPILLASVTPAAFGEYLFSRHWLPVELVSFLLLVAPIGVLYLGRSSGREASNGKEGE